MAGIDRIYGSNKQYDEFFLWVKENNKDLIPFFYPKEGYIAVLERPITNFPVWADKWLLKTCSIKWVINYIREQYGIKDNSQRSRKHNKTIRYRRKY